MEGRMDLHLLLLLYLILSIGAISSHVSRAIGQTHGPTEPSRDDDQSTPASHDAQTTLSDEDNATSGVVCKASRAGVSYMGRLSHSVRGFTCRPWTDKMSDNSRFPDGSVQAAKNHCRNPNNSSRGPWCYIRCEKIAITILTINILKVTTWR